MESLKLELEEAFAAVGMTMLPDDKCCRLLAFLLVHGSSQEAVVTNKNLLADLMIAKKRLNIEGGQIPNAELVPLMQEYIKEARAYDGTNYEWVSEIFLSYKGLYNPYRVKGK